MQERLQLSDAPLKSWIYPVVIVGGYLLFTAAIVGMSGDFPLNDDWMYGLEVKKLLKTGQLQLLGGTPSCVAHIFLGALVCKIFGFSFVTLRCLALALAFVTCLLLWALLRELGVQRRDATFAAFVLASNPLFVNMSFLYMTDVPALAYTIGYALCLLLAVRRRSGLLVFAAAAVFLGAIAVRQSSATFVSCNFILSLLLLRREWKLSLAVLILLVGVPVLGAYYIDSAMHVINQFPAAYDWYKEEVARLVRLGLTNPFSCLFLFSVSMVRASSYLGLFGAPLLAGFIAPGTSLLRRARQSSAEKAVRKDMLVFGFVSVILSFGGLLFLVAFKHQLMPFSPNLMDFPSLGWVTVIANTPAEHRTLKMGLTAAAATFSAVLLFAITCGVQRALVLALRCNLLSKKSDEANAGMLRKVYRSAVALFLVAMACVSFAWSVLHTTIVNEDRYFILPIAMTVPCVCLTARWLHIKVAQAGAVALAIVIALYSTAAQHDYLSWNRARWQAVSELVASGVPAEQIDGGIEFDYLHDPALSNDLFLGPGTYYNIHRGERLTSELRWWSVHSERYIVSLRAIPGYKTKAAYPYWEILGGGNKEVLLLERQ